MRITRFLAAGVAIFATGYAAPLSAQALCDDRYPWTCPRSQPEVVDAWEGLRISKPMHLRTVRRVRQARSTTRAARAQQRLGRATVRHRRHGSRLVANGGNRHDRMRAIAAPARHQLDTGELSPANSSLAHRGDNTPINPIPIRTIPLASVPPTAAASTIYVASQDEVNEIDLAADRGPIATKNETSAGIGATDAPGIAFDGAAQWPASTAAAVDPSGGEASWLRQIFIALGGLLALGSALRLFIG